MYSRRIGKETLAFGHEGVLYKQSFIMYDRSTKSLWVHVTGKAIKGERKGQQLKFLPSVVMSWGAWKKRYPKTTVLLGRMARSRMGHYGLKERTERYGLSVGEGDKVRLYTFADLAERPLVHDTFQGRPIVVVYDKESGVTRAFARGERTFTFKEGVLEDQAGRKWDWFTGWALGDDTKDKLDPLPATVWLINRWRGHHPDGDEHRPK